MGQSESDHDQARRRFVQVAAGAALATIVAPSVLHANSDHDGIRHFRNDDVPPTYIVKVSEHPALQSVGGSIQLSSPDELALNPDHREWNSESLRKLTNGFPCKRGWYPVLVTRVAEDGENAFVAVSSLCPHQFEYQVHFDGERSLFVCCHRGSCFRMDGSWVSPLDPGAVSKQAPLTGPVQRGLRRFPTTFNGIDSVLIVFSGT